MTLLIRYQSGKEDIVPIMEAETIVGFSSTCDIVISDSTVEGRQLKILVQGGTLEIENLAKKTAIWLNDQPVDGRAPFVSGDVVRVGRVVITAQGVARDADNLTKSSDGIRGAIWKSINRDVRVGWLGYRRVMEKLASFVSTNEAQQASECYEAGRRVFFRTLAILFAGGLLTILLERAQWFVSSAILALCLEFFANFSVLLLVARYRMSFAGRIIYPLILISQMPLFAEESCDIYWDNAYLVSLFVILLFLLIGWMVDCGAAFIHEKNRSRRRMRYLLLLLTSCFIVGLAYVMEQGEPTPLRWYWTILAESPCVIWGFAYRWFCKTNISADSQFVAEIASRRGWKRLLYQILAFVLLAFPILGVLALLGDDERHQWPNNDPDVLWTDEGTKDEAWFWGDRGRYLKISDLDSARFYQIPISHLIKDATTNEFMQVISSYAESGEDPSLTNTLYKLMSRVHEQRLCEFLSVHPDVPEENTPEFARFSEEYNLACKNFQLSEFAVDLCKIVCSVSTNSHDAAAYEKLCNRLGEYRATSTNHVQFASMLGTPSVCVVCDSVKCRPEYGKAETYIYFADFQIGVEPFTREKVSNDHVDRAKRETGILPLFVLAALAVMILYRRGADSAVGFWLGVGLFSNVLGLAEWVAGFTDGIPDHVKYALWHGAFSSPLSALSAVWLSVVMSVKVVFAWLGYLSQSVLFVILCWPTIHATTEWKRRWIFVGKTILALAVGCTIGGIVGWFMGPSILVVRAVVVVSLCGWGWWLRKSRRSYTEIPQLGWGFFWGWLATELAIGVFASWIGVDFGGASGEYLSGKISSCLSAGVVLPWCGVKVETGGALCAILSILVMASWLWLFLKQRFLNAISIGGMTAMLVVFALPFASTLLRDFLPRSVQDNVFISSAGAQLISAIACGVLFPAIVRMGRKLIRRVFMHDVYKMEQNVASAIEKVFDESMDTKDSIANVLSCMKISSFAFYERETMDNFRAILSRNWPVCLPESLSVSGMLRGLLGSCHEVIDFAQLPYRPEYFFASFELWRIHLKTEGALLLPICLGTSVRGLLFVKGEKEVSIPTAPTLVDSLNSFGLSEVTPR